MEEKNIKVEDSKAGKIIGKWLTIIIITYIPAAFIIDNLVNNFTKSNFYGVYCQIFWTDILYMPGFPLLLMGLIVNELIYFYKCKRRKNVITLIIILFCILWITSKIIPYSETYEFYNDLHYVTENTYCEDVQELRNIYIKEVKGKWSSKILYIDTSDFEFMAHGNIADEENFDRFKVKYSQVKK
ncbi:hypothetical protein [Clostridium beijerinckii]|uniref:hypothetical protein n=1 Tax=Clostridium beijerinckii TaxID=1520 RepID=UPI00156DA50E|nr:hypothetical protein [Clostridium beijerinckii]NRT73809.1 hypothetical protein [Clostridium beijerinckii]